MDLEAPLWSSREASNVEVIHVRWPRRVPSNFLRSKSNYIKVSEEDPRKVGSISGDLAYVGPKACSFLGCIEAINKSGKEGARLVQDGGWDMDKLAGSMNNIHIQDRWVPSNPYSPIRVIAIVKNKAPIL